MIDRTREHRQATTREATAAEDMERSLVAANAATVLRHRRLGIPLLIWREGRMVEVSAFDVPVPDVEGESS